MKSLKSILPSNTFVRFCFVGGAATALQYLVMIGLVQKASLQPTLASDIGFCLACVFNYLLSRRFTFQSERAHRVAATRYCMMILSGLLLNTACMALFQRLGLHYLVSQVLATLLVLIFNFTVASKWVFGYRSRVNERTFNQ